MKSWSEKLEKVKDFFAKLIYSDIGLEMREQEKAQLNAMSKEEVKALHRSELKVSFRNFFIVLVIAVLIMIGVKCYSSYKLGDTESVTEISQVEEKQENQKTISSGELTSYMVDKLNNIYVKIAMTKLDDKVAYSTVYNYDLIPTGNLTYTNYFVNEYMNTVLINGYPYITYEELGLESDEEAYIATQLAVYETVSRLKINDEAGSFSLDYIKASEDEYEEMVARILETSKKLVDKAFNDTYVDTTNVAINYDSVAFNKKDGYVLIGPFTISVDYCEELSRYLSLNSDEDIAYGDFEFYNFYGVDSIGIADLEANDISTVGIDEQYYVKVIANSNKYYSLFIKNVNVVALKSKVYATEQNKNTFVTLEVEPLILRSVQPIISSAEDENEGLYIEFLDQNGEYVSKVTFAIYNENKELIYDSFVSTGDYTIILPTGKYYIQEVDVASGYILNNNMYEVDITNEELATLVIQNDTVKSLLD